MPLNLWVTSLEAIYKNTQKALNIFFTFAIESRYECVKLVELPFKDSSFPSVLGRILNLLLAWIEVWYLHMNRDEFEQLQHKTLIIIILHVTTGETTHICQLKKRLTGSYWNSSLTSSFTILSFIISLSKGKLPKGAFTNKFTVYCKAQPHSFSFVSDSWCFGQDFKSHYQNSWCSQRNRSLCGPNCESFFIAFTQSYIFQNLWTLLPLILQHFIFAVYFPKGNTLFSKCVENTFKNRLFL